MAPQLQLSTYSQEFSYPAPTRTTRPRPTSAHRKNNPHPRPDFLLPRKPQTGNGHRLMFPTTDPPNNAPLFPPVRHLSVQYPDSKVPQMQPALNQSYSDSKTAAGTVPSAGWLPKPQPADPISRRQSQVSGKNMPRNISSSIPPIRPFKPQLTYSRPLSKSTSDSSGGYSCFHVVKPYKAGHYIIHPEFMSEWLH